MTNTLIDNSNESLMLVNTIKECIINTSCKTIKIATGYWDIPGTALIYQELKDFLIKEGTTFQLLIGADPVVRQNQLANPIFKDAKFPQDYIKRDIQILDVTEEYVDVVRLLREFCKEKEDDSKLQIRIYKKDEDGDVQFFHAKCYIFCGAGYSVGIIGSSNFTKNGLKGNSELNYLETDTSRVTAVPNEYSYTKGHNCWFDEKWNMSTPWNKTFLEEIIKGAPVTVEADKPKVEKDIPLTPYELYIKYLQQQFGDIVDTSMDSLIKSYLPPQYTMLHYQIDAVKECFSIMKRYGGFILGDVVGLGKTVVGLLIIKQFVATSSTFGRSAKVLIIAPPSILPSWKNTILDFDMNHDNKVLPYIDFVTTGSIDKISDEEYETDELLSEEFDTELLKKRYGLILIDESHNFRNNYTNKYQELNDLIGNTNPTPYIGLLSATPQNNKPEDLKNQIYLFQREPNNSNLPGIEGGKLDSFFSRIGREFEKARNNPDEIESKKLLDNLSKEMRDKVLNELVVRRTRSDIKTLYEEDSKELKFPEVKGPHKLKYEMDEDLSNLFYDTMIAITPLKKDEDYDPKIHIGFYRYAAIMFFKNDKNKEKYEKRNLKVESISKRLQIIMRILLVKRLESSFTAFKTSLHNLLTYTNNMIEMIEHNQIFICPDLDVNKEFKDSNDDFDKAARSLRDKLNKKKGNNLEYQSIDFKEEEYLDLLKNDKKLIANLCARWDKNDYDPKFDVFKKNLNTILFNSKINNPHGYDKPRLVIFTEAIDTLKALTRAIKNNGHNVLEVSSINRDKLQRAIIENFDANSSIKKDDYDVIVTTEVLAEGVNLHRANVILNYDAPWNSTRLMQRIGRVNRIGSKEDYVHVFNFFPTTQGNEQIRLIEKAYAKLQAFHSMFGEDNKVFSEREELSEVDLTHMVDDEESPFCKYIQELKDYYIHNPEKYKQIKDIPFDELGGKLKSAQTDKSLVGITDSTNGLVCFTIDNQQRANIFVPLDTMAYLKNNSKDSFVTISDDEKSVLFKTAKRAFDSHVVHYLTAKDGNKHITNALAVLKTIRQTPEITKESLRLVSIVDKAVRHGNSFIIKTLLKYKQQLDTGEQSLFDVNFDLNQWLETTFRRTAEKASQKREEIRTALFEYAKETNEQ